MFSLQAVKDIVSNFFTLYLCERDVEGTLSLLTDDVCAIGSGKDEFAFSKDELRSFLTEEMVASPSGYSIFADREPVCIPCGDGYSVISVIGVVPSNFIDVQHSRFYLRSLVGVRSENSKLKICAIHTSFGADSSSLFSQFTGESITTPASRMHLFEMVTENVDVGFAISDIDADMTLIYQNKKVLELFCCEDGEPPCNLRSYIHPHDVDKAVAEHIQLAKDGIAVSFSIRAIKHTGEAVWFSGKATRIVDWSGRVLIVYIFQDISADIKIRDRLILSEERFRIAFEQTENIIFDYDIDTDALDFLYGEYRSFGLGTHIEPLCSIISDSNRLSDKDKASMLGIITSLKMGAGSFGCTVEFVHPSGSIWARISLTSVDNSEIATRHAIGILYDVTNEMEAERKYLQEEAYRQAILQDAIAVINVNLSTGKIESGYDFISTEKNLVLAVAYAAEHNVYPDDAEAFRRFFDADRMMDSYKNGKCELTLEARFRANNEDSFGWVLIKTHLLCKPKTHNLYSFCYITDIDRQKRATEELEYQAKRDLLTDLYNKVTTEKLIDEYISSAPPHAKCAILIIDLDNFKRINDEYGHIVGDAVLSEIGHMLSNIFRDSDIVGRIGGDEFAVCMKNIDSDRDVCAKADEICMRLRNNNFSGTVSPSGTVGVALYPDHGSSFVELYPAADTALYYAKNLGKDQYYVYNKEIELSVHGVFKDAPDELDKNSIRKNFRDNVIEYIFKILHRSTDLSSAIRSVLRLLCAHFDVSRGYIFETSDDGTSLSNTFEWCANGIEPQIGTLQRLTPTDIGDYQKHFDKDNLYVLTDVSLAGEQEKAVLNPQNIYSMFQCAIQHNGLFRGFMGFDICFKREAPTPEEVDIAKTATDIVGSFLMMRRANEQIERSVVVMKTIMDNLQSYTYVVRPETFELLFINKMTSSVVPNAKIGDTCYRALRGVCDICHDCPVRKLEQGSDVGPYYEIYNNLLDIWTQTSASNIQWVDGSTAYLLNCIDISMHKKAEN